MHLTARSKMTEKGNSDISNVCKLACVSFLCRHPYKAPLFCFRLKSSLFLVVSAEQHLLHDI